MKKVISMALTASLFIASVSGSIITATATENNTTVYAQLSKEVAEEGMVLLENSNNSLPLASGTEIALFGGAGAMRTAKSGTGAGDTNSDYTISVYQGLKNSGYTITSENWLNNYDADYAAGLAEWVDTPWDHFDLDEPALTDSDIQAASSASTAIYVIRRIAGEGSDRTNTKGDFLLTDNEYNNLTKISAQFDNVILLLNTCGVINTTFLDEISNIDSVVYVSLGGMEVGNAIAQLISGQVNFSGKLTDTWAKSYADYPSSANFSNNIYSLYSEDIYVGYRYYETFNDNADDVRWPFGYGLSYTDFSFSNYSVSVEENTVTVNVTVTNTSAAAGKEVVQIYCNPPVGILGTASMNLMAFKKTDLLEPNESQTITMTFAVSDMASYDETGVTGCKSCYVLEAGNYDIYLGNSVKNATTHQVGTYTVNDLTVTEQLTQYVTNITDITRIVNNGSGSVSTETLPANETTAKTGSVAPDELTNSTGSSITFSQVKEDYSLLDDFVGQMENEQLANLVQGQSTSYGSGGIGGLTDYGIDMAVTNDGPSGLRYNSKVAFPCATLMANTWNTDLIYKVGAALASECNTNNIQVLLAPSLNIHRNPLCGRNFEYYSEDPLLNGLIGAAFVNGLQDNGVAATIKHFAANNKEDSRSSVDSRASERTLREIYLKAFEICIEKSSPWCVMTSYNKINGTETAERADLIEGILRDEWGFNGLVMTDWGNDSVSYKELFAGNDVKMFNSTTNAIISALNNNLLTRSVLQRSAKRVIEFLLKTSTDTSGKITRLSKNSSITMKAVDYYYTDGGNIGSEICSDAGVDYNPTETNLNKSLYYQLYSPTDAVYSVQVNFASVGTEGYLTYYVNDQLAATTANFSVTGGWQTWTTGTKYNITIPAGYSTLKIQCCGVGYNISKFTFSPVLPETDISSITPPGTLSADFGITAENLSLPAEITAKLINGSTVQMGVEWDTNDYNPYKAGTQMLKGTPILANNITDSTGKKAYLIINVGENPYPVSSVTINNAPDEVNQSDEINLTATVTGTGNFINAVVWSVNSTTSVIDSSGKLTVNENERNKTLTVTASSIVNRGIYDTVIISVNRALRTVDSNGATRIIVSDFDNASCTFATETCEDTTGGVNLMDFNLNRWTEYNLNILEASNYYLSFRTASPGPQGQITVSLDGVETAVYDSIPTTGGWQVWQTGGNILIALSQGEHTIRLSANGTGYNINWFELTPENSLIRTVNPNSVTRIIASDYDNAISPFSTETCEDTTGGVNLMDFNLNRWTEYNLNVLEAGNYYMSFRIASLAPQGQITVSLDGVETAVYDSIPTTGGWQVWQTGGNILIALPQGEHTIRLSADGTGFNINWFELTPQDPAITEVETLINAIGTVTKDSGSAISTAHAAYDKLSAEDKALVTNSSVLTDAEDKYAKLVTYGDINGDKKITAADALLALLYSVEKITLTEIQVKAADVDNKLGVTAADALLILQYSVDKISSFPIENIE